MERLGPNDIKREDLDIIDHNSPHEPGDNIANQIEQITNEEGEDDGDTLGRNTPPPEIYG